MTINNDYIQSNNIQNQEIEKNTELSELYNKDENNKDTKKELSVEEQIQKSAVEVSLSMNAQVILFTMNTQDLTMQNSEAQKSILDFLAGKDVENQLSLLDIGYEGKAITELTEDEAKELISDKGFFGISETSQRVADFVFAFSDDDLSILQKSREGIVKGFEETEKLWGEELPNISYETQAQTLKLIDAKIQEIKDRKKLEAEEFEQKIEEKENAIKEFEEKLEEKKNDSTR
ncbi:MAG: hypothetical protein U9Q30_01440 [Campylobacterota bacterium]|nr:hypothetical protein [Campylobacterota bacterium]